MASVFEYFTNVNFSNRYILPQKLFSYLQENYSDYISEVGKSVLGQPVYQFSIGNGPVNVLAWSQMHGNESTATLAMLDLLYSMDKNTELKDRLFSKITLDFIFMLNPDGSEKWTRRNALDIDMNRDFLKESSPEIKILKKIAKEKKYDYALNLHDQRTIFTTDGVHPATLSFLAPSFDQDRTLNENRKRVWLSLLIFIRISKTKCLTVSDVIRMNFIQHQPETILCWLVFRQYCLKVDIRKVTT